MPTYKYKLQVPTNTTLLRIKEIQFYLFLESFFYKYNHENQYIIATLLHAAILVECNLAIARIDISERAGQICPDAQFGIDSPELFGDLPDAAFDKTIIAAKYRSRVHQRQGKGRVGVAERNRPALRDRHGHVQLAALAGEIMIQ